MGPSVLVVDDHAGFRAMARALLDADGFRVVGEAGDAASALDAEHRLRPDVLLLDVRLPDRSGLDVAAELHRRDRSPTVVLISTADYSHEAGRCGARAFLFKAALSGAVLRELLG
jgi:DNA-binding NarL/FixJ family response regulator